MNFQAEKLELVRLILETDNPGILSSIRRILSSSKDIDFWENLPQAQKEEIQTGIEEIEKGETIDFAEFTKNHY